MKYISVLSIVTSATAAAVVNFPSTGNALHAPIKLKENQIINIRASADLSPENLGSSSIVIEITERANNSPKKMKMSGVDSVAKIDMEDSPLDAENNLISADQLNPDGQNAVSRSLLEKLINFLFGEDDGLIADGVSFTIGIGGKRRKPKPGELEGSPKSSKSASKGNDDDDDEESSPARTRSRRSRSKQEPQNQSAAAAPPTPPSSSPPPPPSSPVVEDKNNSESSNPGNGVGSPENEDKGPSADQSPSDSSAPTDNEGKTPGDIENEIGLFNRVEQVKSAQLI